MRPTPKGCSLEHPVSVHIQKEVGQSQLAKRPTLKDKSPLHLESHPMLKDNIHTLAHSLPTPKVT
jgi:hypothetical protein